MLQETKIYSEFIKNNYVTISGNTFSYFDKDNNHKAAYIIKDDCGKWIAGDDDKCYTKKAAIYWYIKNRM